jgi:hypothetical protein
MQLATANAIKSASGLKACGSLPFSLLFLYKTTHYTYENHQANIWRQQQTHHFHEPLRAVLYNTSIGENAARPEDTIKHKTEETCSHIDNIVTTLKEQILNEEVFALLA